MSNYKPRCPKRRTLSDDDGIRNVIRAVRARRKRLIDRTHLRIMKLLPGGPEYSPWSDKIRAILEDVL